MRLIDADEICKQCKESGFPCIEEACDIPYQPTINPEDLRPKGMWEKFGYKWKCSACGKRVNIDGTPEENGLRYCMSCGAKMEAGA